MRKAIIAAVLLSAGSVLAVPPTSTMGQRSKSELLWLDLQRQLADELEAEASAIARGLHEDHTARENMLRLAISELEQAREIRETIKRVESGKSAQREDSACRAVLEMVKRQ